MSTHRPSTGGQGAPSSVEGRVPEAIGNTYVARFGVSLARCAVIVSLLIVAACSREPLTVSTIQIGRSLNSDNSVATHTTRFKPTDTMYASVITDARGAGTLTARWMYGGRIVSEQSKDVSYNDQAATEFHFAAGDGFPPGDYSVELLLDGVSIGTRAMRVEN